MENLGLFLLVLIAIVLIVDPILEKYGTMDVINNEKKWILIIPGIIGLALTFNPLTRTEAGYRTFVETITGDQIVFFTPGYHYAGFFSKRTDYPDVVTTVFSNEERDNVTSWQKPFTIRFNDATKATAQATIRWNLPDNEDKMIEIHKAYRSAERLAKNSLVPYSRECLKFAAQLMESETHYSGGRSRLKEDFRSQLQEGQYVLEQKTEYVKDSITKEKEKITTSFIRRDEKWPGNSY